MVCPGSIWITVAIATGVTVSGPAYGRTVGSKGSSVWGRAVVRTWREGGTGAQPSRAETERRPVYMGKSIRPGPFIGSRLTYVTKSNPYVRNYPLKPRLRGCSVDPGLQTRTTTPSTHGFPWLRTRTRIHRACPQQTKRRQNAKVACHRCFWKSMCG